MAGWFYVIDLNGVIFNTNGSGTSATQVEGVLQEEVPTGLPADPSTYNDFQQVANWDVEVLAAHPGEGLEGFSVLSYESSGWLSEGSSSNQGPEPIVPGSYSRFDSSYLATNVPSDSAYISPIPQVLVRLSGDALVAERLSAKVRVQNGNLVVNTNIVYFPGLARRTIAVAPFLADGAVFWTALRGSLERV